MFLDLDEISAVAEDPHANGKAISQYERDCFCVSGAKGYMRQCIQE